MLYLIEKYNSKLQNMKPFKALLTHQALNQVLMELPFQSIKIIKGLYVNITITPKYNFLQ